MSTNPNTDLLKLLAMSLLGGAGAAAGMKLLGPGKKAPFKPSRDIPGPESGAIPVYIDMSPEQQAAYMQLTGKAPKTASLKLYIDCDDMTEATKLASILNTEIVVTKDGEKTAGEDYNWLAKALVAGGGGVAGWKIVNAIFDNIRKRQLNSKLESVKSELADMYTAGDVTAADEMFPSRKKLGHLSAIIDEGYNLWTETRKTAGVVDSVLGGPASLIMDPLKGTAKSSLKTIAPLIAAIMLYSAYNTYSGNIGSAGKRNDLAAIKSETRKTQPRPYIELVPRVKQKADEAAPAPLDSLAG